MLGATLMFGGGLTAYANQGSTLSSESLLVGDNATMSERFPAEPIGEYVDDIIEEEMFARLVFEGDGSDCLLNNPDISMEIDSYNIITGDKNKPTEVGEYFVGVFVTYPDGSFVLPNVRLIIQDTKEPLEPIIAINSDGYVTVVPLIDPSLSGVEAAKS